MVTAESVLTVQPSAVKTAEADQAASAKASPSSETKKFDSNTPIGSLSAFREKAPEMYNKMMERMAMSICHKLRKHKARH